MRPNHIKQSLEFLLRIKANCLLVGKPGIGKTSMIEAACKSLNYELITSHPVVSDPTDYKGLPFAVDGKARFLPYGDLEKLIHANRPTVFFLDDLGQSSVAVQSACMQLLLARHIGEHKVSDHVRFVAATNRKSDKAGVSGILEPVKSRFKAILDVEVHVDDWISWGISNNMPTELMAFIRYRPNLLMEAEHSKDIKNTVSPRTLAAVGSLQNAGIPSGLAYELYSGAAGEGFATEYNGFLNLYLNLPDIDLILKNPGSVAVPGDIGSQYALMGALAARANLSTMDAILKFLERVPEEMGVVCMADAFKRDNTIAQNPGFIKWASKTYLLTQN